MDRFVGSIYIQSIRILWVSEMLLSGLNLLPSFSDELPSDWLPIDEMVPNQLKF